MRNLRELTLGFEDVEYVFMTAPYQINPLH